MVFGFPSVDKTFDSFSEKAADAGKNEETGIVAKSTQEASRLVGHDERSGKRPEA